MKREADGEMGSPNKRSRRGDEEVRLLIPSKSAGSIIGKGGANITKLRSQYKASITVPDCPGPERMLTVSSSDLQTVCQIITDVMPSLEQNGRSENEIRMMIHLSQAGSVIGKGGSKIKELRQTTGARIKIFSSCAPQSTDRIIQINGEDFQIISAINEIFKIIKLAPIKGPINPYDPHNYDDFFSEEYGGYGNGSGSGEMRRGGNAGGGGAPRGGGGGRGGGRGGGGGGGDRFNNRGPPSRGPPMGNYNDRGMGGGPPPPRSAPFGGPPPRGMNGGGSGPGNNYDRNIWSGGNSNGDGNYSNQTNQTPPSIMGSIMNKGSNNAGGSGGGSSGGTSTQVTIPKDLAGAIIGKGGSRIRKIRQDSCAAITIDEPLPGSNDRIITISGLPNQIQLAQYLLQQSVRNNADQRNGY